MSRFGTDPPGAEHCVRAVFILLVFKIEMIPLRAELDLFVPPGYPLTLFKNKRLWGH